MRFSDLPLLETADDEREYGKSLHNLETIHAFTRAFFDKTLLERRDTILDRPPASGAEVTVERFGPAAR